MRIFLVGLGCTFLAGVITWVVGEVVLFALYIPPNPVWEWLVTDLYTIRRFSYLVTEILAVLLSLFFGLCVIAPLAPRVSTGGWRTRRGIVFVLAIFTAQVGIFGLSLTIPPTIDRYSDWPLLITASVVPGMLATALALAFFKRFAVKKNAVQPKVDLMASQGAQTSPQGAGGADWRPE